MGLGLPIYGTLLGFICAVYCFFAGQLGVLGAIAIYSGIGVLSVVLGAVLVALKPEKNEGRQPNCPPLSLAIHR